MLRSHRFGAKIVWRLATKHTRCRNIVFHFWPKMTHPAARFLCDNWVICFTVVIVWMRGIDLSHIHLYYLLTPVQVHGDQVRSVNCAEGVIGDQARTYGARCMYVVWSFINNWITSYNLLLMLCFNNYFAQLLYMRRILTNELHSVQITKLVINTQNYFRLSVKKHADKCAFNSDSIVQSDRRFLFAVWITWVYQNRVRIKVVKLKLLYNKMQ